MGVISCNCNCGNDKDKSEEKNDELKLSKESLKIITPIHSNRQQKCEKYNNFNKETKETTSVADKTAIDHQNNNNQNNKNIKDNIQNDLQIMEVPIYSGIDSDFENMANINNNKEQSTNCFQMNDNTVIDTNVNTINQVNNVKINDNLNCNNINNNCEKEKKFSSCTSDNNNTKSNNTVRTGNFCINNTKDLKNKIKDYKIDKIDFGLESHEKKSLSQEQKELYHKAEKNLNQFLPPKNQEILQIQKIMENIVLNLNNIFQGIDTLSSLNNEDIILFSGNLKKMINYEINTYTTTLYSDKFCVLYPKTLKYYKSKAQFLKNLKPMCVLPINQISRINIAKSKKSKYKKNHLIICNKFGFSQNDTNEILNFFETVEASKYSLLEENQESLIIFTNDDEIILYKWYIIIQILIDNLNK